MVIFEHHKDNISVQLRPPNPWSIESAATIPPKHGEDRTDKAPRTFMQCISTPCGLSMHMSFAPKALLKGATAPEIGHIRSVLDKFALVRTKTDLCSDF